MSVVLRNQFTKVHLSAGHNHAASTSLSTTANILHVCVAKRELYSEHVYIRPQVTTHFSCKQTAGPSVWLLDHQRAALTDSLHHEKQTKAFCLFFLQRSPSFCRTQMLNSSSAAALTLTSTDANAIYGSLPGFYLLFPTQGWGGFSSLVCVLPQSKPAGINTHTW